MRELLTAAEQSVLLPQQGTALFLVLFYRSSQSSPLDELCAGVSPVARFELVAVDLDNAPALADRFNLAVLPALAAIFDGMLLCIDDELTETTCRELAELALLQQQALEVAP